MPETWEPDIDIDIIDNMGDWNKTTYPPAGAAYRHYFTNKTYDGGQNVTVDAPLDEFPLFHVL